MMSPFRPRNRVNYTDVHCVLDRGQLPFHCVVKRNRKKGFEITLYAVGDRAIRSAGQRFILRSVTLHRTRYINAYIIIFIGI